MRAASFTVSMPLISSTPTLRRPTVGRSRSKTICAMAAPITAMSTRWAASAPMLAPTSRTMLSPRVVVHADRHLGVADLHDVPETLLLVDEWRNGPLVAEHEEAQVRMPLERQRR